MAYTFISGATGGIGKAFCKNLALKGENLFITGRSQQKLDELKSALIGMGAGQVECFACDLTDSASRDKTHNHNCTSNFSNVVLFHNVSPCLVNKILPFTWDNE